MRNTCHPLLALAVGIGAVYGLFRLVDETSRHNAAFFSGLALVYLVALAVLLVGTQRWTARALGLLALTLFDFALWSTGAFAAFGWIDPVNARRGDLLRALAVVGGVLIMWGLWRWWRNEPGAL